MVGSSFSTSTSLAFVVQTSFSSSGFVAKLKYDEILSVNQIRDPSRRLFHIPADTDHHRHHHHRIMDVKRRKQHVEPGKVTMFIVNIFSKTAL